MVKLKLFGLKSFVIWDLNWKKKLSISSSLGITKFLDYAVSLMRSPYITVYFLSLLTSSSSETKLWNLFLFYSYARMYDSYTLYRFQVFIFILSPQGNILKKNTSMIVWYTPRRHCRRWLVLYFDFLETKQCPPFILHAHPVTEGSD